MLVVFDEADKHDDPSAVLVAGLAIVVVQAIALRWRRRQPERVMAMVLVAGLAFQLLFPRGRAAVRRLCSRSARSPPHDRRGSRSSGSPACSALAATNFFTTTGEDTVFAMGLAVGAWALGEAARNRRVAIEEEARRAVADEQARIARELHDVIAHSVSVIVVQAAAADDVFDERPDQARAALRSIEHAGRDAHAPSCAACSSAVRPGAQERAAPSPSPGSTASTSWPSRCAPAASRWWCAARASRPTCPPGVDLSAYRIVQEALTNTLRHARATRAEVTLRYGAGCARAGRPRRRPRAARATARAATGCVGMRERAALLGGTLEAGPLPGGGYRVHARLPLEAAP